MGLGGILNIVCARCRHGYPKKYMEQISKGVWVCKNTEACLKRQRNP